MKIVSITGHFCHWEVHGKMEDIMEYIDGRIGLEKI
jgi:hypothetical protein